MRLVVVSGTGTGIGKTFITSALVRLLGDRVRCVGWKPIETGVDEPPGDDFRRLHEASGFHVKQSKFPALYALRMAAAPSLAARREGRAVDFQRIRDCLNLACSGRGVVCLETAGGLYSPLTDHAVNADLVRHLAPDVHVLVAPNRLGVLHDVLSTVRAASADGTRIDGVILNQVDRESPSLEHASELQRHLVIPVWGPIPNLGSPPDELSAFGPILGFLLPALEPA